MHRKLQAEGWFYGLMEKHYDAEPMQHMDPTDPASTIEDYKTSSRCFWAATTKPPAVSSACSEAARRVNQSTGHSAMTIILIEGIHIIGETTLFKPERRYA